MNENKAKKIISIYLIVILVLSVTYYLICLFSRGYYFDSVFFADHNDTFADFF